MGRALPFLDRYESLDLVFAYLLHDRGGAGGQLANDNLHAAVLLAQRGDTAQAERLLQETAEECEGWRAEAQDVAMRLGLLEWLWHGRGIYLYESP